MMKNPFDMEYCLTLQEVMENGEDRKDRTGVGTRSFFGKQMRFNLQLGFPLLTTKKVSYRAILHELLWFISGDTSIKYLVENNVNIWNEWAFEISNETDIKQFIKKVKSGECSGDLGPVYGKQWRDFNGFDQLKWVINEIKTNPTSRRLIVSSWNPVDVPNMALPPCHTLFQFYVKGDVLSLQLYQRSADMFLGVPYNIASYSLLLHMVSHVCDLIPGEFIHTIGDCHIYRNHFDQVQTQLCRTGFQAPTLTINRIVPSLFDFKYEDIDIVNYESQSYIKAQIAV